MRRAVGGLVFCCLFACGGPATSPTLAPAETPHTAEPPEGLSVTAITAQGGLDKAAIALALERRQIDLSDCVVPIDPATLATPRRVVVSVAIDASGKARTPAETQGTLQDVAALRCLAKGIEGAEYPAASSPTQARITLTVAKQSAPEAAAENPPEATPAPAATPEPATPPAPAAPPPGSGPANPDAAPVMVEVTHPTPVDLPTGPTATGRGKFSAGRLVVEILAGAAIGSLASYGTYKSLCKGGGTCIGSTLAAIGVNFTVTPLVEYGVGAAMGGRGSLGWTYFGGLLGFSATGVPQKAQLVVAVILLPITSGVFYELTSNKASTHLVAAPVVGARGGTEGAMLGWVGVF